MNNPNIFLGKLFSFTSIPMYLYSQNDVLEELYPQKNNLLNIPENYYSSYKTEEHTVCYVMTQASLFYGFVKLNQLGKLLVVGPLSIVPIKHSLIRELKKEYIVPNGEEENFAGLLYSIPNHTLVYFTNLLSFIDFSFNCESNEIVEIKPYSLSLDHSLNNYAENLYQVKETQLFNNSLTIEKEIMHFVEKGNLSALSEISQNPYSYEAGVMANDNLRQEKNAAIIAIALACRAAIRGGINQEMALQLSDIYLQRVEDVTNVESIHKLINKIFLDYTERVKNNSIPEHVDLTIKETIAYIENNTNSHLHVEKISEVIGYSRSYLTTKFKKQMGMSIHDYVMNTKINEAKELLLYTSKPIVEISEYLCFSSQSHFQTVFKRLTGTTPMKYRDFS